MILWLILYPKLITRHRKKKTRRGKVMFGEKRQEPCVLNFPAVYNFCAGPFVLIFGWQISKPLSVSQKSPTFCGLGGGRIPWERTTEPCPPLEDPSDRAPSLVSSASLEHEIETSSWLNRVWGILGGYLLLARHLYLHGSVSSMLNLENEVHWLWVSFEREWVMGFGHKTR